MEWAENQLIVQLIITLTSSAVLVAVVNAVASRRKTRAESVKTHAEVGGVAASAAKELGDTAVALLVPMRDELGRLAARVTQQDAELESQRLKIDRLEREVRAGQAREREADTRAARSIESLQAYTAWARLAAEKLSAAGIPIDPPPNAASDGPAARPW